MMWGQAPATKPAAKPAARREPGLYATLQTSMGTIVMRLFEKEAPRTVQNFVDLATGKKEYTDKSGKRVKRAYYNGLLWHRVIPDFCIQTGDHTGTGQGRTDPIGEEFYPSLKFDRPGRVGMARSGPGTSSAQFFILDTAKRPDLDGRYTVFGQVVSGQDVVARIARVPRNPSNDRPLTPPKLVSVTINRVQR